MTEPTTYTQEQVDLILRMERIRERTIFGMKTSITLLEANRVSEDVIEAIKWYAGYTDLALGHYLRELQEEPKKPEEATDASKEE